MKDEDIYLFGFFGRQTKKERKKIIISSFLHSQLSIEFDDLINKNIDR